MPCVLKCKKHTHGIKNIYYIENQSNKKIDMIIRKIIDARHARIVQGPLTYNQDGLATRHNCDFINDPLFLESYKLGESTNSYDGAQIHWRAYVACWAAKKVIGLEGDFIECGVNKGGLSRTVINYVNFNKLQKKFFLLDTFCGISEKWGSPALSGSCSILTVVPLLSTDVDSNGHLGCPGPIITAKSIVPGDLALVRC